MGSNVEVFTDAYERSHGRKPHGRGSWAFTFDSTTYRDVSECWFTPGSTTWSEARKLAKAEASRRNARYASVQS